MTQTSPALAYLTPVTDSAGTRIESPPESSRIPVQFNPETLEVSARNQVQEDRGKKQDKPPVQVVTSSEMSLSVQLIFDETMSGKDVRARTTKIGALMRPGDKTLSGYGENGVDVDAKIPSVVLFEWGNFAFEGTISEFTETLEYFSEGGIPLRASVKFSMTEQSATYAPPGDGPADSAPVGGGMGLPPNEPVPDGPDRQSTQAIAAENGVENLRDPEVDTLYPPDRSGEAADGQGSQIRGALGQGNSFGGAARDASASTSRGPGFASAQASGGVGLASASASAGAGIGQGGGGFGGGAGGGASFGLPASALASGQAGGGAGAGFGAGASLGGGIEAGGALSISAPSASLSISAPGIEAFAGLNPPKPPKNVLGAARKLESFGTGAGAGAGGSFGASASAGFGGEGGGLGATASAQADVGAEFDLQSFLFVDD